MTTKLQPCGHTTAYERFGDCVVCIKEENRQLHNMVALYACQPKLRSTDALTRENAKFREALDEIANGPWGEAEHRNIAREVLLGE